MKVYNKIVYDKDNNIIEEDSYDYDGPVAQARKAYKPGTARPSKNYGPFTKNSGKFQTRFSGNKNLHKNAIGRVDLNDYKGHHAKEEPSKNGGSSKSYEGKKVQKNKPTPEKLVPNPLFKYASYNTIFTLSAMNQAELKDPEILFKGAPHDIIVRSGGIGDPRVSTNTDINPNLRKSVSQAAVREKISEKARQVMDDAQAVLAQGRDLYFNRVQMENIPSLNEKRILTSVTSVEMEITEPMGISLLDKIRGAAANCNYLDHINAPYLLTMEFKGYDEFGNIISEKDQKVLQRKIPIKLISMNITVNQGSTVYTMKAVPYNERGFFNNPTYLRTSGQILAGDNIQDSMDNVARLLNKQVKDEKDDQLIEIPDKYQIVVDELFRDEKPMQGNLGTMDIAVGEQDQQFSNQGVGGQSPGPQRGQKGKKPRKAGTVKQNDNILTIMSELMKSLPRFQEEGSIDKFMATIKDSTEEMYFDYFMIESSVVPDPNQFDRLRGVHPSTITYNIVPYKVHAYSLAEPGTSTGTNFEPFVKKAYNYIFTGDNVDILDLTINYKVAYFSSKLKDIEGKSSGDKLSSKPKKPETVKKGDPETVDPFLGPGFIHQSQPGVAKSVTSGINKGPSTALDQRMDALSNPKGDMVKVDMTILGDPAYLGQTQFIPTTADKDVLAANQKKLAFSAGNRMVWNEIFGNYNMGFGDTVVRLTFRSPADVNDKLGIYDINEQEQIQFSGLYRVIKVISTFADGKFTQVLEMVRFKNQGDQPKAYAEKSYIKKNIHDNRPGMLGDGLISLGEYNALRADIRERNIGSIFKKVADAAQAKLKEKLGINIGRGEDHA
tara:strand:+ start:430 stop:2928 length:2499 start_codon:yes stop_codon:yes gene_type:complete